MATWAILIAALLLFSSSLSQFSKAADFNIKDNGATADAATDALTKAWRAACAANTPSRVIIPAGEFKVNQITLAGPCKAPIEFVLEGTLVAPEDPTAFVGAVCGWISFSYIENFSLSGKGTFNGRGNLAWSKNECHKSKSCKNMPTNIRFNFLTNAHITQVTSLDSKWFHYNILGCKNITMTEVTIRAPDESRNTDGIHIGRSDGVTITRSAIMTGDDCVSMGGGSKRVTVTDVTCGPGHGVSIGSLGKYQKEEPVQGIRVSGCTFTGTSNGVRIKTWPGSPLGSASDMHFDNLIMKDVDYPVIIDQVYCPWNQCLKGVASNVKLSNVTFTNIKGTSTSQVAVKLACSSTYPCSGVKMADIDLVYAGKKEGPAVSACSNVDPSLSGTLIPKACSVSTANSGDDDD